MDGNKDTRIQRKIDSKKREMNSKANKNKSIVQNYIPIEKRPLRAPRRRLEDNIRMNLK